MTPVVSEQRRRDELVIPVLEAFVFIGGVFDALRFNAGDYLVAVPLAGLIAVCVYVSVGKWVRIRSYCASCGVRST